MSHDYVLTGRIPLEPGKGAGMVDFDELRSRAESLLGEHSDQVESGIDKLSDLAGKQFGHAGQIDQAADKLKDFVADQKQDAAQQGESGKAPAKKAPAKKVPPAKKAVGQQRPTKRPHGNRPGRPQGGGAG
jgi:hypothetical protein